MVYHLALRYGGGNRAFAEDMVHDVFIRLCKHVERVNLMDNISGWFYRVTVNCCLSKLNRQRFMERLPVRWFLQDSAQEPASPEQLGIHRGELRRLFVEVNKLSPKSRVAFYAYYVDGKNQQEIAEILGHTKGYVCKLVQQVEEKLKGMREAEITTGGAS